MIDKKLITFGCSFTDNWDWPTHADILGHYYKDYINLGHGGSGNHYIFHNICTALNENIINTSCDVVIQWSSCLREDRIIKKHSPTDYQCAGTVYNNPYYRPDFIEEYFSIYRNVKETLNYISITKMLFNKLNINYRMTFMLDPTIDNFFGEPGYGGPNGEPSPDDIFQGHKLTPLFKELIDDKFTAKCFTMHQFDVPRTAYKNIDQETGKLFKDHHPSPLQYYTFFNKYLKPLFPEYHFENKPELKKVIMEWEDYANLKSTLEDKKELEPGNWPATKRYKRGKLFKTYPKICKILI